jgi:hypothetical protein
MSHTFHGKSCVIFHDGDYTGEAIICDKDGKERTRIECEDLFAFVAERIRCININKWENADRIDILNKKV